MNIFSGVVVFVCIWWVVLFCTLPFGIKNIAKPKDGSMPGAPVKPDLQRKLIITTVISCIVWLAAFALIKSDLVSFHDMALGMTR